MSISYLQITDTGISYAYSPPEDEIKEVLKLIADKPNLAISVTELIGLLKYKEIQEIIQQRFLIKPFKTDEETYFRDKEGWLRNTMTKGGRRTLKTPSLITNKQWSNMKKGDIPKRLLWKRDKGIIDNINLIEQEEDRGSIGEF